MEKFAFIFHPLSIQDMAHVCPAFRYVPDSWLEGLMKLKRPYRVSHITGLHSDLAEAEGWFVGIPLTARQFVNLPEEFVLQRIIQAGRVAEATGAKIVGLGAFSSIVGDGGQSVAEKLHIAVTSGNSYTVFSALEAVGKAVELMGKKLEDCHAVVVGASGSIGSAAARILARQVPRLTLVARHREPLESLAQEFCSLTKVAVSDKIREVLHEADIVLTVTSALDFLIEPEYLKPGSVVCDVARPRNVAEHVARQRQDVLVIEGGVISLPSAVHFGFNFGFPPNTSYACMAETMILALSGRYENFSLGRNLDVQKVLEIGELARKHGFKLAGFRNFDRLITAEEIAGIRYRSGII